MAIRESETGGRSGKSANRIITVPLRIGRIIAILEIIEDRRTLAGWHEHEVIHNDQALVLGGGTANGKAESVRSGQAEGCRESPGHQRMVLVIQPHEMVIDIERAQSNRR